MSVTRQTKQLHLRLQSLFKLNEEDFVSLTLKAEALHSVCVIHNKLRILINLGSVEVIGRIEIHKIKKTYLPCKRRWKFN